MKYDVKLEDRIGHFVASWSM